MLALLRGYTAPAGRILIALMFLVYGIDQILNYDDYIKWMGKVDVAGLDIHVHDSFLPVVIAFQIIGAVAIIIGFQTRAVALAMAAFMVITAISFHSDFDRNGEMEIFMKNLAIAGGFLLLSAFGAGPRSFDQRNNS